MLLGLAAVTTSLTSRQAGPSPAGSSRGSDAPSSPRAELEPRTAGRGSNVSATEDVPFEPSVMNLDAARSRQRVEVRAGQRVRLEIRSSELGSAQIGSDGPIEAVNPDTPARFDLLYESPAELAILVTDAKGGAPRTIGRLDVLAAP